MELITLLCGDDMAPLDSTVCVRGLDGATCASFDIQKIVMDFVEKNRRPTSTDMTSVFDGTRFESVKR